MRRVPAGRPTARARVEYLPREFASARALRRPHHLQRAGQRIFSFPVARIRCTAWNCELEFRAYESLPVYGEYGRIRPRRQIRETRH